MIQLNILELAKQGDTNAINTLVSQWLNLPIITPKTSFKQNCLQIMLESIEAGLGLLRNLPVAGAVIGASSNAVMIYALGYAACQFYEAKQNPLTLEATLVDAQLESGKFLEAAIFQEKIMDQILVYIVLAGNPNKSWKDILPELQAANLSPASIDAITANIKSLPSLKTLLEQINSDFAVPLLAQCQKIADLDGIITPQEAKVLETINTKLNRDLAGIK